MSVRKFALYWFVVTLLAVSACSALPFGGPTPTPTPISITDPNFLIGTWKGAYKGDEAVFNFDAAGNISIAAYGSLQGGAYTLNLETTPYQLDIVLADNAGTITTIIEFVDANTIKIENVYPSVERPSAFSDFFILTRSE